MAMRFFEDGFDYKKYIDERLLEIGDLDKEARFAMPWEACCCRFTST